jgi:hypothetical protein
VQQGSQVLEPVNKQGSQVLEPVNAARISGARAGECSKDLRC